MFECWKVNSVSPSAWVLNIIVILFATNIRPKLSVVASASTLRVFMLSETWNWHFRSSETLRSVTGCLLPRVAQQTPSDGERSPPALVSSFSATGWSALPLVSPYSFTVLLACGKDFCAFELPDSKARYVRNVLWNLKILLEKIMHTFH